MQNQLVPQQCIFILKFTYWCKHVIINYAGIYYNNVYSLIFRSLNKANEHKLIVCCWVIELQTLDLCHFQHDPYHSEELIQFLLSLLYWMQKPCIYYYWWNKCKHNTRLSLSDITITEMMGSPVNTFLHPAVSAVAVFSGPGSLPQYRPPVLPPNLVHSQLPFLCSEYPAQWHRQHFIIFYSILFYI